MKNILETKRLIVKPTTLDNVDEVYELFSDPEVMRYVGHGVRTRKETYEALEKMIQHREKYGFSFGDAYEKKTGAYVGRAGLVYLEMNDAQPDIEVGYVLHRAFWKHGYATELARAFLAWGFLNLQVQNLVAVLRLENEASRRVLERAHMHYVGKVHCYGNELAKYEIFKNTLDFNKVEIIPASLQDYPTIQNLGHFYAYDMSEYLGQEKGWEMPAEGLYEGMDWQKYWQTKDTFPFLIRYANELAGFVIIDKQGSDPKSDLHSDSQSASQSDLQGDPKIDFNMAQFFILRKFKNKGLGRYVANHCFDKFPGTWEVMVIPGNEGAYRFWRSVIKNYSDYNFVEYTRKVAHFNNSVKNIFKFHSKV